MADVTFPHEFRDGIGNVASGEAVMDNLNALKAVVKSLDFDNLSAALQELLIPTGAVIEFGGREAPSGFLMADGSAVSRSTYSRLFAVYGETFGRGDGSTTFGLPDRCGRTGIGAGTGRAGLTVRTLGTPVGAEDHRLVISEIPAHDHGMGKASGAGSVIDGMLMWGQPNGAGFTLTSATTGGGGAHNNMQPSLPMNYIVKT